MHAAGIKERLEAFKKAVPGVQGTEVVRPPANGRPFLAYIQIEGQLDVYGVGEGPTEAAKEAVWAALGRLAWMSSERIACTNTGGTK